MELLTLNMPVKRVIGMVVLLTMIFGAWSLFSQESESAPLSESEGATSVITPSVSLKGRTIDGNGNPAAYPRVRFYSEGKLIRETRGDAQGFFYLWIPLNDQPKVQGELQAFSGDQGIWLEGLSLVRGELLERDLQLKEAVSITGAVTALDKSTPLANIAIYAEPIDESVEPFITRTDERGIYRFVHLKPGKYRVHAMSESGPVTPLEGTEVETSPDSPPVALNFIMAPFHQGFWKHYQRFDGLVHPEVSALLEDDEGALWVGTRAGISRFDGADWKSFTSQDGLVDNRVLCLIAGPDQSIWAGSATGISRWDGESWTAFPAPQLKIGNEIIQLFVDPMKRVWALTRFGQMMMVDSDGAILKIPAPQQYRDAESGKLRIIPEMGMRVHGGGVDPTGGIWIGTSLGLFYWNGESWEHRSILTEMAMEPGARLAPIQSLWTDRSAVWIVTYTNEIFRKQHGQTAWEPLSLPAGLEDFIVRCGATDDLNVNWFGCSQGLLRYANGVWRAFSSQDAGVKSSINAICTTRDGSVWAGSDNGLSRYDERKWRIYNSADGIPDSVITDLQWLRDGVLLAATEMGLYSNSGTGWRLETGGSLSDGAVIHQLCQTEDGRVWLATEKGLMSRMGAVGPWELAQINDSPLDAPIHLLTPGNADSVWVTSKKGGISEIVAAGNTFVIKENDLPSYIPGNATINAICLVKSNGQLWIGTSEGLYFAHPEQSEWKAVAPEEDGLSPVKDSVRVIYQDSQGVIWVGFDNSGAASLLSSGKWEFFGPADGLSSYEVQDITEDDRGRIWFAHDDALSFYDGITWNSLDVRDGLRVRAIRALARYEDGSIWMSGLGSVGSYRPTVRQPPVPGFAFERRSPGSPVWKASDSDEKIKWTVGDLMRLEAQVADLGTVRSKRRFRYYIQYGEMGSEARSAVAYQKSGWSDPVQEAWTLWRPNRQGSYTLGVQYIDQNLNYSAPIWLSLSVAPVWYRNLSVIGPMAMGSSALLIWMAVTFIQYRRQKSESNYLREEVFRQAQEARLESERARQQIEFKNQQLEAAKESAEQANHAKSDFLAAMSHEFRTPLNAIVGYSEMLVEDAQDNAFDPERLTQDLTKIQSASKKLLQLINQVLDLSKIEAGKMTLFRESFDVDALIQEVVSTTQILIESNQNRWELVYSKRPGSLYTDRTKLYQILMNLISNAAKFTTTGMIRIRAWRGKVEDGLNILRNSTFEASDRIGSATVFSDLDQEVVMIQVEDTGIGMTPDQMNRLFDNYSQPAGDTEQRLRGAGLGLTLSRKFCRLMGGELFVESQKGKGSVFSILTPVQSPFDSMHPDINDSSDLAYDDEQLEKLKNSPYLESDLEGTGPIALVVDDDRGALMLMKRALNKQGYRVALASNGKEALDLARRIKPAVISLDVIMPGMDGWETLGHLKSDTELAGIPVVMTTVLDDHNKGYALGAIDFLTKPVDQFQLAKALDRHAGGDRSRPVLVVDDDHDTRERLVKLIARMGWKVVGAENGAEAFQKVEESKPCLVFLDLMMPVMDGFEFLDQLREKSEYKETQVVVVTAKDLSEHDRERLQGRVLQVVKKSETSFQKIVDEIKSWIQLS